MSLNLTVNPILSGCVLVGTSCPGCSVPFNWGPSGGRKGVGERRGCAFLTHRHQGGFQLKGTRVGGVGAVLPFPT